jgi:hypothetical protein
MPLFTEDLSTYLEGKFCFVAQQIPRFCATDPNLLGHVERLWNAQRPRIPVIHTDKRRGNVNEQTCDVIEYGRQIRVTEKIVEVAVPFDGDGSMFKYRPSSCKILHEPIQVENGHLMYGMPFDPEQQGRYNTLLEQVVYNLDMMRRDEDAFSRDAVERLKKAIEEHKKQLAEDAAAARKFDFPVS